MLVELAKDFGDLMWHSQEGLIPMTENILMTRRMDSESIHSQMGITIREISSMTKDMAMELWNVEEQARPIKDSGNTGKKVERMKSLSRLK